MDKNLKCTVVILILQRPRPITKVKPPQPDYSRQRRSHSGDPNRHRKQPSYSLNIRLFLPWLKEFIKQLKQLNEYPLASHMERYQPLDRHQQQRLYSMFVENKNVQQEVIKSGKPREEVFQNFIKRYDMKLKSKFAEAWTHACFFPDRSVISYLMFCVFVSNTIHSFSNSGFAFSTSSRDITSS